MARLTEEALRAKAADAARDTLAAYWPGGLAEATAEAAAEDLLRRIVDALFTLRAQRGLRAIKYVDDTAGMIAIRSTMSPDGINDPTALVGFSGLTKIAQAAADVIVENHRRGPNRAG